MKTPRTILPSLSKGAIVMRTISILVLIFAAFSTATPPSVVYAVANVVTVDRTDDPVSVPSDCLNLVSNDCSLRGAIHYANTHPTGGTEIILTHGAVYTLSIPNTTTDNWTGSLKITADATIDYGNIICLSNCAATIQGGTGWADRILAVSNGADVTLTAITIQGGNVSGNGGGIENSANLTLNNVTVKNNTATGYGGGIYTGTGTLTITNGSITGNTLSTSTGKGGGIAAVSGTVNITGATLQNNTAVSGGGGIYNQSTMTDFTLTNTTLSGNQATAGGGGAIITSGKLEITDGAITGNTAGGSSGYGGGIDQTSGALTVTNATITSNTAGGYAYGGGIYASGGTVQLAGAAINSNTANSGGGIYFAGNSLSINGGSVDNNTGGGIMLNNSASFSMTGSEVNGNSGYAYGTGLYVKSTSASISQSTIANNSDADATAQGAGIYLKDGSLGITDSTISGNTLTGGVAHGAGIYVESAGTLSLTRSTVSGNNSYFSAGFESKGQSSLYNSTVSGNTGYTGAVSVTDGTTLFSNVTVAANQSNNATVGNNSGSTLILKNTLIAGNTVSYPALPQCSGPITSQGHNLLGDGGCTGVTNEVNGDLVGTYSAPIDPVVGALANNGGYTYTHALLMGSPAIEAGDDCLSNDQRGLARPYFSKCDIGAYEYNGAADPVPHITSISPRSLPLSCAGTSTDVTISGSNFIRSSVVRWNGVNHPTTYVSSTQLTLTMGTIWQDTCTWGSYPVTVFNPAPGGGTSNVVNMGVIKPVAYIPAVRR